jgi:hypothetical protein
MGPAARTAAASLDVPETQAIVGAMSAPAFPVSPRAAILAALSAALPACLAVGDVEAARVAHEAIGRLLGSTGTPAAVVDLAAERERRAGG